jgi:hypothetical protein
MLASLAIAVLSPPAATYSHAAADPLASALVDTIGHACVPLLTRQLPWPIGPGAGDRQEALLKAMNLDQGVTQEADAAIGPASNALSGAILASGTVSNGAYAMALGGVQKSCRLYVYRAEGDADPVTSVGAVLMANAWKFIQTAPTSGWPKTDFLRRMPSGHPVLVTVLRPVTSDRLKLVIVVDAFPPETKMPDGY